MQWRRVRLVVAAAITLTFALTPTGAAAQQYRTEYRPSSTAQAKYGQMALWYRFRDSGPHVHIDSVRVRGSTGGGHSCYPGQPSNNNVASWKVDDLRGRKYWPHPGVWEQTLPPHSSGVRTNCWHYDNPGSLYTVSHSVLTTGSALLHEIHLRTRMNFYGGGSFTETRRVRTYNRRAEYWEFGVGWRWLPTATVVP